LDFLFCRSLRFDFLFVGFASFLELRTSRVNSGQVTSRVESSRAESENFGLVTWPESDVTWLVDSRVRLESQNLKKVPKPTKKKQKER